jgi:hypothetical protein
MDVAADYEVPNAFIGWRREGGWFRGGELVDSEWSYSMLPFRGEERKLQHPFQNGKRACEVALGSHAEGQAEDAVAQWFTAVADI